jgi:dienelactone hydrolase
MLKASKIEYHDDDVLLEGYYAYNDQITEKRPAILICHDWSGRNDFACDKANQLANLGYVGFALDMFGKGILGQTKDEKSKLIAPLLQNREALKKRVLAALRAVKTIHQVDPNHIGAIGFCFGGLCVLDLARCSHEVKAVASFHGLLNKPENITPTHLSAKILVLHGFDDPMVPPDQVIAFSEEMTKANADWQVHIYGQTMHSFTNPLANDPDFGTVFNKQSNLRAQALMQAFFKEVFGT